MGALLDDELFSQGGQPFAQVLQAQDLAGLSCSS
jgi:hypothetical protein